MLSKSYIRFFCCLVVFLIPCANSYAKTIITEGVAFIGSGITLEEAKRIALNDARQKALDEVGVFFESETEIINYELTKDKITIISGAIMTSEVLEIKKEIAKGIFVLKVKAKFKVSETSLKQALTRYQNKSKDNETIEQLMQSIEKLQNNFFIQKNNPDQAIEIVDEINFSVNKLSKLLTTKQTVNYELNLQRIFITKIKTALPKSYFEFSKLLSWETTPRLEKGKLSLTYNGQMKTLNDEQLEKYLAKCFYDLNSIEKQYDKLKLKVHPICKYKIKFELPVYVYINGKKHNYYILFEYRRNYGLQVKTLPLTSNKTLNLYNELNGMKHLVNEKKKEMDDYCKSTNSWSMKLKCEKATVHWMSRYNDFSSHRRELGKSVMVWYQAGRNKYIDRKYWRIDLPKFYQLNDINDIEVRIGRINPNNIDYKFFDEAKRNELDHFSPW